MADFSPPFANSAERRLPTEIEREQGFACGPADRTLFAGLQHRVESELGEVIAFAGLSPTDSDFTQVRQAIVALIAAATGGGETEDYLLLSQARTRLPFFPDVQNTDGRILITAPSTGTVRVPGGVTFLHRGIYPVVTAQTDLLTDISKTYHLRWSQAGGFVLKDLANVGYNPTAAAESHAAFDSTFDDMLIARIITNASNIATITNLANKTDLALAEILTGTDPVLGSQNGANYRVQKTLNWARNPKNFNLSIAKSNVNENAGGSTDQNMFAYGLARSPATTVNAHPVSIPLTRYNLDVVVQNDGASDLYMLFSARA
ncbi:hypothetical protein [Aminobacter phage Erebus]|nr:hypothetical protein [Aminobacter phage Erebus]